METVNGTPPTGLLCHWAALWVWPVGVLATEEKEKKVSLHPCEAVVVSLDKTALLSGWPALQ